MNVTRKIRLMSFAAAWLGFLVATAAWADTRTIYVSTTGNDAWSGKLPTPNAEGNDGPVATPRRARDLVRSLRSADSSGGPIRVELRGGTYFLNECLILSPDDSGTEKGLVTWAAYQGEHPDLSGGQRLTGWTRIKINGRDAWVAKLPGGPRASMIRELWLDGARLTRARWPKQGTLPVVGLSDKGPHNNWSRGVNEFRFAGTDVKAWPSITDGEAIVANRWAESHLPITSVDEKNHVIHLGKKSVFLLEAEDRYWIENVKENLTEPGEFYVDPHARTVSLIPPAGVDPNVAQTVAPLLEQVLRLDGRPEAGRFVQHLEFRGLSFSHAEWSLDPSSSGFGQAAIGVPGAVGGQGVRSCHFEACEIAHVGTYGIDLGRGCQDNHISRCKLTDLGAGGVKIGETQIRGDASDRACRNVVSDCVIADGGNVFPSCVALWIGQSPENTVVHNDIHGFWYTAISIGWTWGYGPAAAQRNLVEANHIHHLGTKAPGVAPILSDMGCVYTLGNHEGTIIRGNLFHDVAGLKYGGWGIYFDEGTTHILAENNLVYRTTHGGFHQHYGKENTFRNNILALGRDAQVQRTRVEGHQSFRFEHNLVYWEKGPLFAGDWSKPNAAFDGNTYWRVEGPDIHFGKLTWAEWRKAGMDLHSKIADPHPANPGGGNFQLSAASQEALAGFVPFDLSAVGPR